MVNHIRAWGSAALGLAVAGVLVLGLAGCGTNEDTAMPDGASESRETPSEEPEASEPVEEETQYDTAMTKCVAMASAAMPNGFQGPNQASTVLDSNQFCVRLAAGYSREKFAELYNDPIWLANELEIWSDEGVP